MLDVRFGDRGPLVAAMQILLRRAGVGPTPVDGIFGDETVEAVQQYQSREGIPNSGQIDSLTWNRLGREQRLWVFGVNDIYDPQHLRVQPTGLGRSVVMIGGACAGVIQVVQTVRSRLPAGHRILLLRFWGHGRPGLTAISAGTGQLLGAPAASRPDHFRIGSVIATENISRISGALVGLRPLFVTFGSVEMHGCRAGAGRDGTRLLTELAGILGVPASAGQVDQWFGHVSAFRFEGSAKTVYPGGASLRTWAAAQAALAH